MPATAMIPERPVALAALVKLMEKTGEALHPMLLHVQSQRVGEKPLKEFRGFFRRVAEVHLLALGDIEKLPEPLELIEQLPSGPGRRFQQVMEEDK